MMHDEGPADLTWPPAPPYLKPLLAVLQPGKIIQLVLKLKEENDTLKKSMDQTSVAKYEEGLEKLERETWINNIIEGTQSKYLVYRSVFRVMKLRPRPRQELVPTNIREPLISTRRTERAKKVS